MQPRAIIDIAQSVLQLHHVQVLCPKPSRAHSMDFRDRPMAFPTSASFAK